MFTGIITDLGHIETRRRNATGAQLTVRTQLDLASVNQGDSIAVNGCCLTAIELNPNRGTFVADVSQETLKRTALGKLAVGARVNLELALRVGDRLGGHLVQGHVDGLGRFDARRSLGDSEELSFTIPDELLSTVVEKGSIAIDGISLTIATLQGSRVTIAVIPHTLTCTNLASMSVGSPVNVETDIIAKYVARALQVGNKSSGNTNGLSAERLLALGFGKDSYHSS